MNAMDFTYNETRWQTQYRRLTDRLERIANEELAAMTDEQALAKIESLVLAEEPWREDPNSSGLVEQQRRFQGRGVS